MLTQQDLYSLFPAARRMCNIFILWKSTDKDAASQIGRKIGLDNKELKTLLGGLKKTTDSLWIDMTHDSPAKLRINGFEVIKK